MPNVTTNRAAFAGGGAGIGAAIALIVPFIAQHEGHATKPYRDLGGVLTVCYGHTGLDIHVKTYSDAECKTWLNQDVSKAAYGVLSVSPQLADKPQVLAAAISFSYNLGISAYSQGSVAREFNQGNYKTGCANMLKYSYVKKKFVPGLFTRRKAEYAICMKGT